MRYKLIKAQNMRSAKNSGDCGGNGSHWYVLDTQTGLRMHGWTKGATQWGGFLRKTDAQNFANVINGEVSA